MNYLSVALKYKWVFILVRGYRAPSATSSPWPSPLHLISTSARRLAKCDATPRGARPCGQASPSPTARSASSSVLAPAPAVHVTPQLLPFASRLLPLVLFPTPSGIWPRTYSLPSRFPVSVFFILRAGRVEWGGRCSRIKEKGWTKKNSAFSLWPAVRPSLAR